jgi:hypothetical protein
MASLAKERKSLVAVLPACQGRVFYLNEGKRIAKQAVFTRVTFVAEQVAGNFRHLETASDIDIVPCQRAVILQHRRQHRPATTTPALFRLLNHRLNAQVRMGYAQRFQLRQVVQMFLFAATPVNGDITVGLRARAVNRIERT